MLRDWFWQISQSGQGPDHYFNAEFEPSDAPRLRELVQQHAAPDFLPDPPGLTPGAEPEPPTSYSDARTHEKLVEQLTSGQRSNIWVYTLIEVRGSRLCIEAGYGGAGLRAETTLIETLARSPDLTLLDWSVDYGGQGYDGGTLARGRGVEELLKYLQASLPPP